MPVPSIETPTAVTPAASSPTPQPTLRANERRIKGVNWRRVTRPVPRYRGRETSSLIWLHGDLYIKASRPGDPPQWVCDRCDSIIKLQKGGTTANARRHLRRQHQIMEEEDDVEEENIDEDESDSVIRTERNTSTFSSLYTTVSIEKYRNLLLRWIVQHQIPFSAVEQTEFRALLLYLQPSLNRYMISGNTALKWVVDDFRKGQTVLK